MKNKELYHKTIDILVKAYLNDTLLHENACGCAIGNLIAYNKGLSMVFNKEAYNTPEKLRWVGDNPEWCKYLSRLRGYWSDLYPIDNDRALEQIAYTGYSVDEVDRIEKAFESADDEDNDNRVFDGLMAVVEALDIIHENTDSELTTEIKAKFQKVNQ